MRFFEMINRLEYQDVYENIIPNAVFCLIGEAKRTLSSSDYGIVAEKFATDSFTKEFIRNACYVTIKRLRGIRVNSLSTLSNDVLVCAAKFYADNIGDFNYRNDIIFTEYSCLPIWDVDDFDTHTRNYLTSIDEYLDISEIVATYFTCIDNPLALDWCKFLALATSKMSGDNAKELNEFFNSILV